MLAICTRHKPGQQHLMRMAAFCPECDGMPISRKLFREFLELVEKTIFDIGEQGPRQIFGAEELDQRVVELRAMLEAKP